ncbi:MAG: cell wall metabolism sensor histidine kinase WalK, partial [Candidatus Hydrogenedentes bacterium]|nr:cell wall metabolism sensor histidine kinase WalK [Candidatus Hydrogenedentota bacterium]
MARRALIWHLFPIYLLVIILSLLSVVAYTVLSFRTFYLEQVRLDLKSRAALLHDQVVEQLNAGDGDALQELCDSLGHSSLTRITVILPTGRVVADSEQNAAGMDNHSGRVEVKQALNGGLGYSVRFSDTLDKQMMYIATPLLSAKATLGVLRVALPITAIDDTLRSVFRRIAYGSLLIALVAAAASWVVARRITRPLRALGHGAERFARGEFAHKLETHHSQEIDALADTMNQMAAELNERMNTVLRQKREQDAVLSSMVEGVIAVDSEVRIISLNGTAATIFGTDVTRATGKKVAEVVRNSSFHQFLDRALHSGESI